ncbi:MAG: hypothetical protein UR28_C0042G0004 [Candidatus Peregrinibacteria bacterium GW2011_GWF2_33_10]|nr:MAG: hypothetical protein UR28_C0042G0004 [Candidatus Peregrinibacteria bacterium GW2011_GWF2_33_10]OGJ45257.1 MAG: hypothetical protein A2272_00030 [Candidatus Peregrinibacteria bacterium RIFOXYA12_FULL_33_12]OGJ45694.1 MAG: hypothetical protein A2263_01900 [Candidatus Peregrinibacteria bacterium RIFOXYA2_FULL_33_21]OGJ51270.1 MAG: hypothetical protein A2307_00335 [Candidatus Peregrinibacteria bacterium RIFOXYB2_FULL_33_20]
MASSSTLVDQLANYDTVEMINRTIAIVIIVAGALSLAYVFMGAISFVTASGQEDKVKQAIGTIRHAILGLLLTIISVFIVGTVGNAVFGLNVIKYISYREIFSLIQSMTNPETDDNVQSLD